MKAPLALQQVDVLLLEVSESLRMELRRRLDPSLCIADDSRADSDRPPFRAHVVVVGASGRASGSAAVSEVREADDGSALIRVDRAGDGDAPVQLPGEDVCFTLPHPPDPRMLAELIEGALARQRARAEPLLPAHLDRSLDDAKSLAETVEHLVRAVTEGLGATSAALRLLDEEAACLVDAYEATPPLPASTGPIGFVVHSGRALRLASHEPWPTMTRGQDEQADHHLLAVPVVLPGAQLPIAVLVAYRTPDQPAFGTQDQQKLTAFAGTALVAIVRHTRHRLGPAQAAPRGSAVGRLFRPKAVQAHARGRKREGRPLAGLPRWTQWTFGLLNLGFVAGLTFAALGRIDEWVAGPAVVRLGTRIDVTAEVPGVVRAVEVAPRQEVVAGQPLVRFASAQEAAQLQHLEAELEQRLRRQLRDPSDTGAEAALIQVRTALEGARARLDERILRSPTSGRVSDVRLRPGQHVEPGEIILSLVEDEQRRSVIAFLPGHARPQLAAGQVVRLAILGYRDARTTAVIESIGNDVIGPREARQVLGETLADAVPIEGPVILVRAHLETTSFTSGGRSFGLFDGMQGLAEVRTRSRSILMTLFPGLEAVFKR